MRGMCPRHLFQQEKVAASLQMTAASTNDSTQSDDGWLHAVRTEAGQDFQNFLKLMPLAQRIHQRALHLSIKRFSLPPVETM